MDVVADAGAVRSRVIIAEHLRAAVLGQGTKTMGIRLNTLVSPSSGLAAPRR